MEQETNNPNNGSAENLNKENNNINNPNLAEATKESSKNSKKSFNIGTGPAILTGAVIIALTLIFILKPADNNTATEQAQKEQPTVVSSDVLTIRPSDHVWGDPAKAKIIAFEYSDSDCPFCQQFHQTMKDLEGAYGPDIAWVYRYFPLSIHPNAHNEAIALECSAELGGDEVFYKYLDKLFAFTVAPAQSDEMLSDAAVSVGLDKALFAKCIASSSALSRVDSDAKEAQEIGAQGTPYTIFVNRKGEQAIVPGAYPFENVKSQIDTLLK